MRDTRKNKSYFEGYLEANHAQIQRFEDALRTIIDQSRSADKRVQTGFISLSVFYFNKLISMYSAGHPLNEIKAFIPDVIDILEKSWKPSVVRSYDYYIQCVWMLSISHMLELDEEQMNRLRRLGETYRDRDSLIDFLLVGRIGNREFFLDEPYPKLWDVLTSTGDENRINRLKEYLQYDWYEGHHEAGWHKTHHIEDYAYRGYWSFESGAIVKILGLDDSSLKDVPYYPYDMVHFKE